MSEQPTVILSGFADETAEHKAAELLMVSTDLEQVETCSLGPEDRGSHSWSPYLV